MKNKKKDFAAAFEEAINALDQGRPKEEVLLPLLHLAVEASQLQLALSNISYTPEFRAGTPKIRTLIG